MTKNIPTLTMAALLICFPMSVVALLIALLAAQSPSGSEGEVASTSEISRLSQSIDSLGKENRELKGQIGKLAGRLTSFEAREPTEGFGRQPIGGVVAKTEFDLLVKKVENMNAPVATASFQNNVVEVIKEREDAQRQKREERRIEQDKKRMDSQMKRYTEDLGLSNYQAVEMGRVLLEQEEKLHSYFRGFQENGGPPDHEDIGNMIEAVREETQEQLFPILSADQLSRYEESSSHMISIEIGETEG